MALYQDFIETEKRMGFTEAVAVEASGARTIYISGQTGESEGLEAQSREAFGNLARRLEAARAAPADVVKLTTYIVDYAEGGCGVYRLRRGLHRRDHPPRTADRRAALFQPHLQLEVEAIAVVEAWAPFVGCISGCSAAGRTLKRLDGTPSFPYDVHVVTNNWRSRPVSGDHFGPQRYG